MRLPFYFAETCGQWHPAIAERMKRSASRPFGMEDGTCLMEWGKKDNRGGVAENIKGVKKRRRMSRFPWE